MPTRHETRAKGLCVTAVTTALFAAACGSSGVGAKPLSSARPDPYDVTAARACAAFTRFVDDVKDNQPNLSDANTFSAALQALEAGHGPSSKWAPLAADLENFLNDSGNKNSTNLIADGKAAGQECASIPEGAQVAGHFG